MIFAVGLPVKVDLFLLILKWSSTINSSGTKRLSFPPEELFRPNPLFVLYLIVTDLC